MSPMTMGDISTITSDHSGECAAKANFISHQIHSPATHSKYVHSKTPDQGTVQLAPPPSYLVVVEMEEMDLPSYEEAVEVTMAEKEKNSLEKAE